MADIELVIKISEDEYNIAKYGQYGNINVDTVRKAIANGTLLPKGHGDLIDPSYEVSTDGRTVYDVCGYLAPTIIEADSEVKE